MRRQVWKLRLLRLVKVAFLLSILGAIGLFGAMEYTARPKFCSTCHIMKPYYESWKASSHKNVPCTDCHYEPGMLETFEGKFKALSQIAKYVTATEGTKPWAEVSDYSCMRTGCHSKRLLSGRIKFGRVNFDHRRHLTELRRGKKLRCTSCHSQIMEGSHMKVTQSVCFTCHFHKSKRSHTVENCNTCHGPPKETIQVAGQPFRHRDYTDKGVACRNCHRHVTQGTGNVPKQRCATCHHAAHDLAKHGQVEFLHTTHVTQHKVECFNCHTEITHRLEALPHNPGNGCGSCHRKTHSLQRRLYSGRELGEGAPRPSRMYQTRVACDSCHTCLDGERASRAEGKARKCKAREASCIHCHGKTFKGILGRLQKSVSSDTQGLEKMLAAVRGKLQGSGAATPPKTVAPKEGAGKPADAAKPKPADAAKTKHAQALIATAARDLGRVRADGSWGMHNPQLVRTMLGRARKNLVAAGVALGMPKKSPEDRPRAGKWRCTDMCHAGIEDRTIGFRKTRFSHVSHIYKKELTCASCHTRKPHGRTLVAQKGCVSCHHVKKKQKCDACHYDQSQLRKGAVELEGLAKQAPDKMAQTVGCKGCHKSVTAGHTLAVAKKACTGCHDKGYADLVDEWRGDSDEARLKIEVLQLLVAGVLAVCPNPKLRELAEQTDAIVKQLRTGIGVHNVALARNLPALIGKQLSGELARCLRR